MLESTLEIKYMALVSTTLPMATITKVHGTKVVGKVMACICFEMVMEDVVNGMLATSNSLYHHKMMLSFAQFRYLSQTFTCFGLT